MSIDTVKLKSPTISRKVIKLIENQCVKRMGVHVATGEVLYEITKGDLLGSWDSRISLKPMHEDYIVGKSGKPELHPCEPYLILECSVAKVMNGQNIYGAPSDFQVTCQKLLNFISELLGVELPLADKWIVRRVDWAEVFELPFIAIQEFFEGIHAIQFPRRKGTKYGDHAIYFAGSTTTVKLYHKGPEFAKHDAARMRYFLSLYRNKQFPDAEHAESNRRYVERKIEALQRLANKRLRVEVEIHADKLDSDFGHQPRVTEVTDEYLTSIHDREVSRLLREGKSGMETVRNSKAVLKRLQDVYDDTLGNRLHGFWCQMATNGETYCKKETKPRTFYHNRKLLVDAGVSWNNTDVQLIQRQGALPVDFAPIRSDLRRCTGKVREKPAFILDRNFLKLAA